MYWKVRVDCYYALSLCAEDTPKRDMRWFLVEAPSAEDAFVAAKEYASKTAAFGCKLVGIETMSASDVTLPVEIKG